MQVVNEPAGAAAPPTPVDLGRALDRFRPELRAHCRRMLRSEADADDAVQETMIRAWRRIDRFEGRSSLRAWLYRIATNVSVDQVRSRERAPVPVAVAVETDAAPAPATTGTPVPGPEEAATTGDAVRRALLAAVTRLPPRQRAALVLYDVFRWPAGDVAALLATTEAGVTSAVQRARASLAGATDRREPTPEEQQLAARYLDAFNRYDPAALAAIEPGR